MAETKKTNSGGKKSTAASKKGSTSKTASTGTKKNTTNKKNTKKKNTKAKFVGKEKEFSFAQRNYGAVMLSYLIGGVLLVFVAFVKGFNVWTTVRSALFAFFGVGFYLLAAQCIIIGITMALHKLKRSVLITNIFGLLFNALFTGIVHLCINSIADGGMQQWKQQLTTAMNAGWQIGQGKFSFTGGILGGLFGGTLLHSAGKGGALIISVLISIVCLFMFLNIDLETLGEIISNFITGSKEKIDDSAEERKEKRAQRQQEKAERVQARIDAEEEKKKKTPVVSDAFDFDKTEIENDVTPGIDRETGMPLREIKRFYPDDRMFSYQGGASETPAGEVKLGDIEFISAGQGKKKPAGKKTTVGNDASVISEAAGKKAEPSVVQPVVEEPKAVVKSETPIGEAGEVVKKAVKSASDSRKKTIDEVEGYVDEKKKKKNYVLPPIDCLNPPEFTSGENDGAEMQITAKKLVEVLRSFNVETRLVGISRGPSVTRYELAPAPGVKISKILNLADDIALGLAASGVRIEAPIPNKSAVGIEVPNKTKSMVTLREIISSSEYSSQRGKLLTVALGKDITGGVSCTDLSKMPHLLIAGTTGSGKSVCLNCMIASILYNATPDQVKLLMIDPKQVEFTVYNGIPHLLVPVITDARKAAGSLAWAVSEMDNRYKAFSNCGVRDIASFNKYVQKNPEMEPMPQIVIFIDELNDLMMVSPKEVEDSICRLAQKARAAGMHLVVATQRPSVDVITGIIKANIPSRLSLAVSSAVDSRTILDCIGAENLLGNGDMLFSPVGISKPVRIQGAYLSDEEIERLVTFIKGQTDVKYSSEIMDEIEKNAVSEKKKSAADIADEKPSKFDPYLDDAIDLITTLNYASTTIIQRKLSVGFSRAGRIMDQLEQLGFISPADGNKPRNVLITRAQYLEMKAQASGEDADGEEDGGEEITSAEDYDIFSD